MTRYHQLGPPLAVWRDSALRRYGGGIAIAAEPQAVFLIGLSGLLIEALYEEAACWFVENDYCVVVSPDELARLHPGAVDATFSEAIMSDVDHIAKELIDAAIANRQHILAHPSLWQGSVGNDVTAKLHSAGYKTCAIALEPSSTAEKGKRDSEAPVLVLNGDVFTKMESAAKGGCFDEIYLLSENGTLNAKYYHHSTPSFNELSVKLAQFRQIAAAERLVDVDPPIQKQQTAYQGFKIGKFASITEANKSCVSQAPTFFPAAESDGANQNAATPLKTFPNKVRGMKLGDFSTAATTSPRPESLQIAISPTTPLSSVAKNESDIISDPKLVEEEIPAGSTQIPAGETRHSVEQLHPKSASTYPSESLDADTERRVRLQQSIRRYVDGLG